jgi:hypothetical protein
MSGSLPSGKYYVYAQYNPFFPYGPAWWLYAIPTDGLVDDKDMKSWKRAVWLNDYDWRLDALRKAIGLPQWRDCYGISQTEMCNEFMRTCPAGAVCQIDGDGRIFTQLPSVELGTYLRIVRQRQLDHIAKAQEENEG